MNNLYKEISAYLLNDNQLNRAIRNICDEIAKPVIALIKHSNYKDPTPEDEAYFLYALEFIMMLGWIDDDYEEELEHHEHAKRLFQIERLKELVSCCELRIKEIEEYDNEQRAERKADAKTVTK